MNKKNNIILEALKKSDIFSVLKPDELKKISKKFSVVNIKDNEYVFMQDDPAEWLYLAAAGKMKVLKHTKSGKDVILEIKLPGELFCCTAVLDDKPFPESAQAIEDSAVIRTHRKDLLQIILAHPELKMEIARYSSEKLHEAYEMMKSLTTGRVEKRVAAALLKLGRKTDSRVSGFIKINVPLSRQEIADMAGTTVESCIRAISEFQKQGIVKSSQDGLRINPDRLSKIVDSQD